MQVYLDNGSEITAADNIANLNPIRYRGYYYDTDTGFYYLQSRYYDPVLCRFLNADGYASTGSGFVGYNMYAYCNNNPVNYSDPTGQLLGLFLAVVVTGLLIYAIDSWLNSPNPNNSSGIQGGQTVEVNIQYTRDLAVDYGIETFIITSYTYMPIDDSRLQQSAASNNTRRSFTRSMTSGAFIGVGEYFVNRILKKIPQTALTGAVGTAVSYGGTAIVFKTAWDAWDAMIESENLDHWESANNAATEGVLKVCGVYKFEGTGGSYSSSFILYYPWDGRGEVPLPSWK